MREMKIDFTLKLFKEITARWIEDLFSTKSRQIESVEVLSRICRWQKYLDGSNSYWPDRNFLDGSRSYREKFQKASMDQNCDKICQEKKSKGLDR